MLPKNAALVKQEAEQITKVQEQMAGPLSAALITIATFSLMVMGLVIKPEHSFVDEIFMALGLFSLISAARIIDYHFDRVPLDVTGRFKLNGGGYFLFCLVIGAMSFAILFLYAARSASSGFPWVTLAPAFLTWACITGMLMSNKGSAVWFVGLMVGLVLFVFARFI